MPITTRFGFGLALFAATVTWSLPHVSAQGDPPDNKPIALREIQLRGIAGALGQPLGTVIRVHGTIVDGNTFRTKEAAGSLYLKADQVSGVKLLQPAIVRLKFNPESLLKPGDQLAFIGWESANFRGVPLDPNHLIQMSPHTAFAADHQYAFATEFQIDRIDK